MRNHYIPQFYLNGFSNSEGNVWVYNREDGSSFCAGTKRIANQKNFYSDETEAYLANKIENPANNVIKRIREFKPISKEDKLTLSKYMIVMWKRVPEGKARLEKKSPRIINQVIDNVEHNLEMLVEQNPQKNHLISKQGQLKEFRQLVNNDNNFLEELTNDTWLKNMPPEKTPRSVKVLAEMNWQFLTSDKSPAFFTSDNPVFFFEDIGISNREKSEVTFPISSNVVLCASWRMNLGEVYIPAKQGQIHQINRRTANIATRFVFHSEKHDWIAKLTAKKKHKIRRLF